MSTRMTDERIAELRNAHRIIEGFESESSQSERVITELLNAIAAERAEVVDERDALQAQVDELNESLDDARALAKTYRALHPDSRNNLFPWEKK